MAKKKRKLSALQRALNQITSHVAQLEGGRSQAQIGDIRQITKTLALILANDMDMALILLSYGRHELAKLLRSTSRGMK